MEFGLIAFASPIALLGLLALPFLWLLLRAVPPPAAKRLFPPVVLMLDLRDGEATTSTSPLWLRILRIAAVAAAVLGLARPELAPQETVGADSANPILVLVDGGWAGAPDWNDRAAKAASILDGAARRQRPALLASLAAGMPDDGEFRDAAAWTAALGELRPLPWEPDFEGAALWIRANLPAAFETHWISDGLHSDAKLELAELVAERGALAVYEGGGPVLALRRPELKGGIASLMVSRQRSSGELAVAVDAFGPDPAGIERRLDTAEAVFADGERDAAAEIGLPREMLNRATRFEIRGADSAGSVVLAAGGVSGRKVAIVDDGGFAEGSELLSPGHFLRRALEPNAELVGAASAADLLANPDAVILADSIPNSDADAAALLDWVESGGLLIRFAGPRLAAAGGADDALLPVRLRPGGRTLGGALSWESPKRLAPFAEDSPFFGLAVPGDVLVRFQVLAEPGPDLEERAIAELEDGTPLATSKPVGEGRIVLFHVSAETEWSNLPISGLFADMLERLLIAAAAGPAPLPPHADQLVWTPERHLTAFGEVLPAETGEPVDGSLLAEGRAGPDLPPGLYSSGAYRAAVPAVPEDRKLRPASWPDGTAVAGFGARESFPLAGILLALALLLFSADVLATLRLGGHALRMGAAAGAFAAAAILPSTGDADDAFAIASTHETVLAYMRTGDPETDLVSEAGLRGLSAKLAERTSVEPGPPVPVDPESDELAFFPLIYWPVTPAQADLTEEAYEKINAFLGNGGMILFDTKDADIGGFQFGTANSDALAKLGARLNLPALQTLSRGHVLSRSYYLLADYPGRHVGEVWVADPGSEDEGAPSWKLAAVNDGVTPVVVGGNDWASAWAAEADGSRMFPIGWGVAGERQRETAFRFGINLVMHALTGNYKSDQLHIDAILERLGS